MISQTLGTRALKKNYTAEHNGKNQNCVFSAVTGKAFDFMRLTTDTDNLMRLYSWVQDETIVCKHSEAKEYVENYSSFLEFCKLHA